MKINWKIIDTFLQGEMESDDCSTACKEEIARFLQTHMIEIFSEESLEFLAGVFDLVYKREYEQITGQKIPNIFRVIQQPEEEVKEEDINE